MACENVDKSIGLFDLVFVQKVHHQKMNLNLLKLIYHHYHF